MPRARLQSRIERRCKRTIKLKLKARVNRWMPRRSSTLLEQLSSKGSIRKAGDEFVSKPRWVGAGSCGFTGKRSYPTMILKNAALLALIGTILNDGSSSVEFVFNFLISLRGLVLLVKRSSRRVIYAFWLLLVMVFFRVP